MAATHSRLRLRHMPNHFLDLKLGHVLHDLVHLAMLSWRGYAHKEQRSNICPLSSDTDLRSITSPILQALRPACVCGTWETKPKAETLF